MANAKDLRKRISSVKNTQQITKAMKMVSAAKLRRAQENITSLRPYSKAMEDLASKLSGVGRFSQTYNSELFQDSAIGTERKSCLLVIVTSDRGLCGALNTNVLKNVLRFLSSEGNQSYEKCDIAFIGKKGYEFFKNRKSGKYFSGILNGFGMSRASELATEFVELFLKGEYQEIKFIYSEFVSAISQRVRIETLLSLSKAPDESSFVDSDCSLDKSVIIEPDLETVTNSFFPRYFATLVCRIIFDSVASEHAARMSAMENATKNAGEMIRKITLLYNKTRQAAITKELLEITAGAEAQNN